MSEQTVTHTVFDRRMRTDRGDAFFGNCVNCAKPYREHVEVRDGYEVRAFCHEVYFLREKRANPSDGGGRRRSAPEAKH